MKRPVFFVLSLLTVAPGAAFADSPSAYEVLAVENGRAELDGDARGLHVGDSLYYARSPFKFPIAEIKGNVITVTLPEHYELEPKQRLYRVPNDTIKKSMKLESKLKHAIED